MTRLVFSKEEVGIIKKYMESETPENISEIIRKELRIERSSSIRTKIKNIKNSARTNSASENLSANVNQQTITATANPATANPATANPATVNPATANPATVNPATANPATLVDLLIPVPSMAKVVLYPAAVNPATVNPATVNPATVNPATVNPATANSATFVNSTATDVLENFLEDLDSASQAPPIQKRQKYNILLQF
ncbi:hypothetical protein ACTA71_009908 [Dictyostelium dimigraforme]